MTLSLKSIHIVDGNQQSSEQFASILHSKIQLQVLGIDDCRNQKGSCRNASVSTKSTFPSNQRKCVHPVHTLKGIVRSWFDLFCSALLVLRALSKGNSLSHWNYGTLVFTDGSRTNGKEVGLEWQDWDHGKSIGSRQYSPFGKFYVKNSLALWGRQDWKGDENAKQANSAGKRWWNGRGFARNVTRTPFVLSGEGLPPGWQD